MRKSLLIFLTLVALTTSVFAGEPACVVNINTADAAQLALLPGIGIKTAERIVAYRAEHGPFRTASALAEVKGIGAKSLERITAYVAVEGETTLTYEVRSPRKPRAKK